MAYVSLYRKYRSQSFDQLIGQDHVIKTLRSAIEKGKIAHAYLFTGPRGTGKTSTARLLAKALQCEDGPSANPDPESEICQLIAKGGCPDVLEFDAASESGVSEIREIIVEQTQYLPMMCRYKVFIIDEVHDLSTKAFDALLKTIEEPPAHVIFILATTEIHKVPPTIRSRCQRYEFHRGSMQDLTACLTKVAEQEGIDIEPSVLAAISRMADGGFRDALSLLEQAILTADDAKITLAQVYDQLGLVSSDAVDELLTSMRAEDIPAVVKAVDAVIRRGRDPRALVESMLYRLSELTHTAYGIELSTDPSLEASTHEVLTRVGRDQLSQLRAELVRIHQAIRDVTIPRVWLEAELVKLSLMMNEAPKAAAAPRIAAPQETRAVVKDSHQAPKPAPEAQQAKPEPKPAPEPQQAKPEPKPAQAAVKFGTLKNLVAASSKAAASRLMDATEDLSDEGKLRIHVTRQIDHDWFYDNPKKMAFLQEKVNEAYGPGLEVIVSFRRDESKTAPDESNSVELPLQGKPLEVEVKKVFQLD